MYTCVCVLCVHASAGTTSSASPLGGSGDVQWPQPHLSWAVGSHVMYFPLTISKPKKRDYDRKLITVF